MVCFTTILHLWPRAPRHSRSSRKTNTICIWQSTRAIQKHKLDLREYTRQPGAWREHAKLLWSSFCRWQHSNKFPHPPSLPHSSSQASPWREPDLVHPDLGGGAARGGNAWIKCRVSWFTVLSEYFSASPLWGKHSSCVSFVLYSCGLFIWILALLLSDACSDPFLLDPSPICRHPCVFRRWTLPHVANFLTSWWCLSGSFSFSHNVVLVEVLALVIFNLSSWWTLLIVFTCLFSA